MQKEKRKEFKKPMIKEAIEIGKMIEEKW